MRTYNIKWPSTQKVKICKKIFLFIVKKPKMLKERTKKIVISSLSELPFFDKKPKELTNIQLSKELPFHPSERKKRPKRLTKHQILQNVLPFF